MSPAAAHAAARDTRIVKTCGDRGVLLERGATLLTVIARGFPCRGGVPVDPGRVELRETLCARAHRLSSGIQCHGLRSRGPTACFCGVQRQRMGGGWDGRTSCCPRVCHSRARSVLTPGRTRIDMSRDMLPWTVRQLRVRRGYTRKRRPKPGWLERGRGLIQFTNGPDAHPAYRRIVGLPGSAQKG